MLKSSLFDAGLFYLTYTADPGIRHFAQTGDVQYLFV